MTRKHGGLHQQATDVQRTVTARYRESGLHVEITEDGAVTHLHEWQAALEILERGRRRVVEKKARMRLLVTITTRPPPE